MGSPSSTGGGVPPGFRFHPTDEELLHFYLKKKISFQKFDMEVIREIDLNKIEPWDLQERCKIGSTPQNEWYLFSHKDRKYPTGSRTNRATNAGFWKATGRDKCIRNSFKKIGMRKTLVFYHGRAPHGQKTDWIMHEYRLEDDDTDPQETHEDGWVVCRVFKKKNLFKVVGNSNNSSDQGGVHNGTGRIMMLGDHGHRQFNNISATATSANNWNQYSRSSANFTHLRDPVTTNHQYFPLDHHGHDLNYISHMNQINNNASSITLSRYSQYPPHDQLEAQNFINDNDEQNFIMKPLMLNSTTSTYDRYHLTAPGPPIIGTTHVMDECDQSSDHQVVNVVRSDDDDDDDHNNLNEWDRLAIPLTDSSHHQHNPTNLSEEANPSTSSTNQINHLSLRSEVNFWGYGK